MMHILLKSLFRCSDVLMGSRSEQLSPLQYNVYTEDLTHHLQATGEGCYVGGAWVNSPSCADDIVLLIPTVTARQTLLEVCRAYMKELMTFYTTQRKQYDILVRPKQSQGQYST